MALVIDNIRSHVTSVTKRIYRDDQLTFEREISVDEYLDEVLEELYDKYVVKYKGTRLRFNQSHYLYGKYLAAVYGDKGCKTEYELHR